MRRSNQLSRRSLLRIVSVAGGVACMPLLQACQSAPAPATVQPAAAPAPATRSPAAPATQAAAPSATPAASSKPAATAVSTASGTGQIVYAQSLQIKNLDPGNPLDYPSSYDGLYAIFSRLYTFDANMKFQPDLATSYQVSEDGTSWTFKLRPGVTFHDGTPFDANAVKVNFERLADPNPTTPRPNGGTWRRYLKDVVVADPSTVTIVTKQPVGAMLNYLAHGSGGIISPTALKKYGDDIGLHPVGTGPYQVKEFIAGQSLTLVRNDGYFGTKPSIQTLIMKPVLQPAARVAALESGEADVIYDVPPSEAPQLGSRQDISVIRKPSLRGYYVGMNLLRSEFKDKSVRQAMNYAVNKEAICKALFFGYASPLDSPFAPGLTGYSKTFLYDYSPDKAKQLLGSAGWQPGSDGILRKGGTTLSPNLLIAEGEYPEDIQVGQAVQSQLKQIGVDLKIWKVESSVRISNYLDNPKIPPTQVQYDTFFWAFNPSTGDPGSVMSLFDWRTNSLDKAVTNWDMVFYNNPTVNDLIGKGETTVDPAKRAGIYQQIQKTVMDDAPWIYLYVPDGIIATRKNVSGVDLMPVVFVRFDGAAKT
ncbi:MAG TPA: ABC transporter substrate-binding protein [Chloroflexota bacterium]|nr:ABC transporter substrate-binding protein [Chloroflexota bacterium]